VEGRAKENEAPPGLRSVSSLRSASGVRKRAAKTSAR